MLILQGIGYAHPNKDVLFSHLHLSLNKQDKIALVGNNGTGKSTLLQIIAGVVQPIEGTVVASSKPYYIPQNVGQLNHLCIAEALHIDNKLKALQQILSGDVTEENMLLLDDDWGIEERAAEALLHWGLADIDLWGKMDALSGGQKTKLLLAGIHIHQPDIVLLDEPSNHLDVAGRELLYSFIQQYIGTLIVVSHDRVLLNLLNNIVELSSDGLNIYGGNYNFYTAQKKLEAEVLSHDLQNKEKALRKARQVERETAERQQKLDARGRSKQDKAGVPTIMLNTLRNNAEKTGSRLKDVHAEKVGAIAGELNELRDKLPGADKMRFGFDDSSLHNGKLLVKADDINFSYGSDKLWPDDLSFELRTGERYAIKGDNGSGKTTLIKMMLGQLEPSAGDIYRADNQTVYIDQEYSLLNGQLTVYEQAQQFNKNGLHEHDVKIRLDRFLFNKHTWDKNCVALSGGERMRLVLCCLTIGNKAPDIIVMDEPINNLDIQNVEILTAAINDYNGTLIVVSHDEYFLEKIKVRQAVRLKSV